MNIIAGPIKFSMWQSTKSGFSEAESRKYHLAVAKNGVRWLYGDAPNSGDVVYKDGGKGSQGFGGAVMKFELVDGSFVEFIGPWHTDPKYLFEATGVDLRDKHYTRGIAALRCEHGGLYKADDFFDVVHYDESPIIGSFNRVRDIAKAAANELGKPVTFSCTTNGGGHGGCEKPDA